MGQDAIYTIVEGKRRSRAKLRSHTREIGDLLQICC
jgi:hypothetical protein